jgi:tRNA pseudouridine38-40 synthase
VQDHLQAALTKLADAPIEVIAAGRTDTGVHASAQVVHFDTESVREPNAWVRGTNSNLREEARVVWSREVPEKFHARYSAQSRTYKYLLLDEGVAPAILRSKVGWYHKLLDLERMSAALGALKGEHDFSAFRDAQCQAKTPIKMLHEATVAREGPLLVFAFRANAFLHHMVRNIVGSLVYVGAGRHDLAEFQAVFASQDRRNAAPTFMPDGLYLAGIEYDPSFGLPAFRPQPLLGSGPR